MKPPRTCATWAAPCDRILRQLHFLVLRLSQATAARVHPLFARVTLHCAVTLCLLPPHPLTDRTEISRVPKSETRDAERAVLSPGVLALADLCQTTALALYTDIALPSFFGNGLELRSEAVCVEAATAAIAAQQILSIAPPAATHLAHAASGAAPHVPALLGNLSRL